MPPACAQHREAARKYRVPKPSPWPGVNSGEVLCAKCYTWGIGNKMHAQKAMWTGYNATGQLQGTPNATSGHLQTGTNANAHDRATRDPLKVGVKVIISHLERAVDLNGKVATILLAENDDGKIVVEQDKRVLRLKRAHLTALETEEKAEERPKKVRRKRRDGHLSE